MPKTFNTQRALALYLVVLLFPFEGLSQQFVLSNPIRFYALGDSYTLGQSVTEN